MKKIVLLALVVLLVTSAQAQNEGSAVAMERFKRDNSIFITGGPSFPFGKNIGDYKRGINFEVGYVKRLYRVLSLGASISHTKFSYDPALTKSENANDLYRGNTIDYGGDINGWHERYDAFGLPPNQQWDFGYLLNLKGGDISMTSLAVNIKINLIPVSDNTKITVYVFAKPFISRANRKAVSGVGERYVYEAYEDDNGTPGNDTDNTLYPDENDDTWYADGVTDSWSGDAFPELKEKSSITGGIFLGPGIELFPSSVISVFAQASFGYTLPVSYVSTESYSKTTESYLKEKFPMVKEGFTSLNVQVGLAFNF